MVVAKHMDKPNLKISVSDSDSSTEASNDSENESIKDEAQHSTNDNSDDEDVEADVSDDSSSDEKEENTLMTNEGWADSISKILSSNKPKNKKTLVLSRAKKHADIVKSAKTEKPSFEIIGESVEEKPAVKKEEETDEPPIKKVKQEKPSQRIKPNILEKDRERLLTKIATKGVVQLFNAVRNQQKSLEKNLEGGMSEGKKEKILKKFDKRTFLDTLMGNSKSIIVDKEENKVKNEMKDEEKPRWNALRDDFMMGAKMKDWDKESVEEIE